MREEKEYYSTSDYLEEMLINETKRDDELIKVEGNESFGYIVTACYLDSIVYYKYSCCASDTTDMINVGNAALNNFFHSLLE
jgi:hypothetical protein